MTEVTMEMSMEERLDEAKLPQVKAVMENDIPVKLGSTKEGFVHWKVDFERQTAMMEERAKKLQAGEYKDLLKYAAGGILTPPLLDADV